LAKAVAAISTPLISTPLLLRKDRVITILTLRLHVFGQTDEHDFTFKSRTAVE
jgi:hypothetical protein